MTKRWINEWSIIPKFLFGTLYNIIQFHNHRKFMDYNEITRKGGGDNTQINNKNMELCNSPSSIVPNFKLPVRRYELNVA